jgi:hypothetical protein
MTVGQLLGTISSEELTEWSLLYQLQAMEKKHQQAMAGGGSSGGGSRPRR